MMGDFFFLPLWLIGRPLRPNCLSSLDVFQCCHFFLPKVRTNELSSVEKRIELLLTVQREEEVKERPYFYFERSWHNL